MADAERELGHGGLWTYKPWIFQLEQQEERARRRVAGGQRWLVFLEASTMVAPEALQRVLDGYDAREEIYLGRALRDETSCIIHHYSLGPDYPLAPAGFALSGALARRLAQDLRAKPLSSNQQIEPVWELAKWISELGVQLTNRSDAFCGERLAGCATWVSIAPRAARGLAPEDVVIGVKTVGSFHASRLPLVHSFWAADSPAEVLFLSNEGYTKLPGAAVIDLSPEFGAMVDPALESTKQGSGHCSKMEAIVKYFARHKPGKRWYVVTDDDTLLHVGRLLEVLGSHDDKAELYVGERYGWAHTELHGGTNYVTTGGGMALSGPALRRLAACEICTCSRPDSPDDMTLGSWFRGLGVPIVHEEGFHQSEPHNYHPEVLRHSEPPVSFHRFAVHLPAGAPEAEKVSARRANWERWAKAYFGGAPRGMAGRGEEL